MKIKLTMIGLMIVLFAMTSCLNNDIPNIPNILEKNIAKISIDEGVAGTVIYMEGNFMPIVIDSPNDLSHYDLGTSFPVSKKVQLYELTTSSDVKYSDTSGVFIDSIGTNMISETISDLEGFFQLNVPDTGKYSIFVIHSEQHFVEYWGSGQVINPIEINEDSILIHNIHIDHNTCW